MVVVGRLEQKMPGPIFCPSPALVMAIDCIPASQVMAI